MRILTDEEIDKIYDRWLHEPKEPKFLNWTTYLTTETARLVREETLKELIEQQGSFFIQGAVNAIDSPFIKTGVPNNRGYWVFISEAKLSQGVMPK
jgi:hypothetical protein